ncbi:MAG TPA: hypothetical protein VKU85_14575, partial [bacterium]|nr:hypothetical protein [bacterium]
MRPATPIRVAIVVACGVVAGPLATFAPAAASGVAPSPSIPSPASVGTLELTVTGSETGARVPWASLLSVDGAYGFLADEDGVFRVTLPAGTLRFHVSHVSYR